MYIIESTNINKVKIIDEHKSNFIEICGYKSERKNAKSETRRFYIFKNSSSNNIIKEFNHGHIREALWAIIMYNRKGYKNIFIRFNNNNSFFQTKKQYSFEQYINQLFNIMELINGKEFYFTLNDLHNDSNIKYLIGQYYHGENFKQEQSRGVKW